MSQMPAKLGKMLSSASSIYYDADKQQLDGGGGSPLRQLPALVEASQQHRLQSLRPLMHRLRWARRGGRRHVAHCANVTSHGPPTAGP